jgi:predicted transcriptional regulator
MPKKESRTTKSGKAAKTIYLSQDVVRRLEKAAQTEGMSNSVYIEQTLKARFKKDAIEWCKAEQIRHYLQSQPFRPFWLETVGGNRIRIGKPQWVFLPDDELSHFAVFAEGNYHILTYRDLLENIVIEAPPPEPQWKQWTTKTN